ncbi:recombinase family protein [Streptomyces sp. NPDC094038]|uniref:recombinase family protein n=1 Tax=Streptomyces sp. NPDC094038 TaxID=3366055 RepID=UPI0037F33676
MDYLRVSTEDQAKGYGITCAGKKTGRYIGVKGWEHVGTFTDVGVSGALESHERPDLRRLMEEARKVPRSFDIVVVNEGRVIGRTGRAFWRWVWELQEIGIFVAVVKRDYDNSTPEGESKMRKDADYAEDERNSIRERTQGGIQEKAEEGGYVGGKVPFGYRVVGRGRTGKSRLVLDECCGGGDCEAKHEACALRRGRSLFVALQHWGRAAATLNAEGYARRDGRPWCGQSLRQQVLSPIVMEARQVFRGSRGVKRDRDGRPLNGDPVVIPLPAVFAPAEAEELLRTVGRRPDRTVLTGHVYSLSGRIVSPCGRRYVGGGRIRRGRAVYRCQGRGEPYAGVPACSCPCLAAEPIEQQTWRRLTTFLSDADRLRHVTGDRTTVWGSGQVDFEGRRADLDRKIGIQTQALAVALGVAAKQVVARGLCLAEAEKAVERLIAPVQDELDVLLEAKEALTALEAESAAVQGRAALLVEVAAMAQRTLGHLPLEGQKEFMAAIDAKVTLVEPPQRGRSGQPCAMAAWFSERRLGVPLLTDEGWAKVEPMITHRPRGVCPRLVMTGILYKLRTGVPWSSLPALFGRPATLQTYAVRWRASGFWKNAMRVLATAESTPLPAAFEPATRIECSIVPEDLLATQQNTSPRKPALAGYGTGEAFKFRMGSDTGLA